MTCILVPGATEWSCIRDEEGHRNYKVKFLVACSPADGPANALQTPGLPTFGSQWLIGGDIDIWAWCRWNTSCVPRLTKEPNTYFDLEYLFSTKPPILHSCNTNQVENPLLMPPKVSGSSIKYSEEKTIDRFGNSIQTSSFEQIRGPQVEFDANRSSVKIEMNVADLNLALVEPMVNTLNETPIWNKPTRCVKLADFSWDRKFYGTCFVYYTWYLTFESYVKTDPVTGALTSGFDRDVADEGTKAIRGHWDTDKSSSTFGEYLVDTDASGVVLDPGNPKNFIAFQDFLGNLTKTPLRSGLPAGVEISGTVITIVVTTPLVAGALTIAAQPTSEKLVVKIHDPSISPVETGELLIIGLDDSGVMVEEAIDISSTGQAQDYSYTSQRVYSHVTSMAVSNLSAVSPSATIGVKTDQSILNQGVIHIESYQESDFTLLGVPLTF